MSPFGAVTTADGALNSSVPLPGVPALPRVISSLPSGLNLKTWWPLPLRPRPSVTHTLPSRSTCRPCGNRIRPAPKLLSSLPDASNLRIGSSVDSAQANGAPGLICDGGLASPQRSPTHTLVPSGSIATALVDPHFRPSGSCPQFSIERYGLGAELVGALCARAKVPPARTAKTASASVRGMRAPPLFSPLCAGGVAGSRRNAPGNHVGPSSVRLVRAAHERRQLGVEARGVFVEQIGRAS